MPVTRDLSPAKRKAILSWLKNPPIRSAAADRHGCRGTGRPREAGTRLRAPDPGRQSRRRRPAALSAADQVHREHRNDPPSAFDDSGAGRSRSHSSGRARRAAECGRTGTCDDPGLPLRALLAGRRQERRDRRDHGIGRPRGDAAHDARVQCAECDRRFAANRSSAFHPHLSRSAARRGRGRPDGGSGAVFDDAARDLSAHRGARRPAAFPSALAAAEPITIGEFYTRISKAIGALGDGAFVNPPRNQVGPDLMYESIVV